MGLDDAKPDPNRPGPRGLKVEINELDNEGNDPTPPEVITGKGGRR